MDHRNISRVYASSRQFGRLLIIFFVTVHGLSSLVIARERPPTRVIAAQVTTQELTDSIDALGTSAANEAIILTPKITEKITKLHFYDGQQVKRNQLLVQLNDQEEQANLRAEQAILAERLSALRRAEELFRRKAGSEADLDVAKARVSQSRANIEALKTRIRAHQLRAPFTGVMGLREVSEGALVEPDDMLSTLDDLSIIKVDFDIPVVFLSQLSTGLKVAATTSAWPEKVFYGELKSLSARIDPVTRTVKGRAWFDNKDNLLLPGLLMQLQIMSRPRTALTVPESAVFAIERQHFVYTVNGLSGTEDNQSGKSDSAAGGGPQSSSTTTVVRKEVQIGSRSAGVVEILQGINAGDLVISHGNLKVGPGRKVNVVAIDDGTLDIASVLNAEKASKTP